VRVAMFDGVTVPCLRAAMFDSVRVAMGPFDWGFVKFNEKIPTRMVAHAQYMPFLWSRGWRTKCHGRRFVGKS
jgi:hypothetical protein